MTTTPQAALLSEAAKLADKLEDMTCIWSPSDNRDLVNSASAELRRLDAKMRAAKAALIEEQAEVERLQAILAKLQPAQAGELPPYIYGREAGPNEKVWTEQAVRAALAARKPDDAVLRERIRIGISLALNDLHAPVHKPSAEILEASEQGGDDQWAIEDGDYYPLIQPDANGNTVEFTRAPVMVQVAQEPAQAGELPDEREAFKSWVKANSTHTPYGSYGSFAWDAWQARAALLARKPLSVDRIHQIGEALADGSYGPVGGPMESYQFETDTLVDFVRFVERAHGIGLEVKT